MRVKDKVAIVTGAAQGIGLAYADILVREGARVAYVDLKLDAAEANAAAARARGGEAIALQVDVSSPEQTKELAARVTEAFGGIDILVNNAAIYEGYEHYSLMELPLEEWERFLKVNLTSVMLCTWAVVPSMIERGGGKIVNQSSAGGAMAGNHYGITKLGVQGFTVGFARELGKHKICVNCIAPGVITTAATKGHYDDEALEAMRQRMTVIGRLGEPEDMANALLFLVSSESDFMTGQVLHVDGGFIMNPL